MKMILVLSTSTGKACTEMLTGVREFAQGTDWNIQSIEFNGSPFPVRDLIRFWSPVGCIVEASGNGLLPGMISHRAFGTTPVVYIGGDTTLTPANATCVTHNAVAVGEAAARELLTLGFTHFAFIGWKGQATGHAVLEELQKARIHQAKQMLVHTNLPVSSVAESCGYASLAHFRDTFRKETGVNPLTWRKENKPH